MAKHDSQGQGKFNWRWALSAITSALVACLIIMFVAENKGDRDAPLTFSVFFSGSAPVFIPTAKLTIDEGFIRVDNFFPAHIADTVVILMSHLPKTPSCVAEYDIGVGAVRATRSIPTEYQVEGTESGIGPFGIRQATSTLTLVKISFKQIPPEIKEVYLVCRSELAPNKLTFSQRRIRVKRWENWIIDDPREKEPEDQIKSVFGTDYREPDINIDFDDIATLPKFRLLGGAAIGPDEKLRRLSPDGNSIVADWNDDEYSELRDVLLLISGVLFGLSGACIVECLRPYVDRHPE